MCDFPDGANNPESGCGRARRGRGGGCGDVRRRRAPGAIRRSRAWMRRTRPLRPRLTRGAKTPRCERRSHRGCANRRAPRRATRRATRRQGVSAGDATSGECGRCDQWRVRPGEKWPFSRPLRWGLVIVRSMSDARRSQTRAAIAFVAIVARHRRFVRRVHGLPAAERRGMSSRTWTASSNYCLAQACASPPPILDRLVLRGGGAERGQRRRCRERQRCARHGHVVGLRIGG